MVHSHSLWLIHFRQSCERSSIEDICIRREYKKIDIFELYSLRYGVSNGFYRKKVNQY